MFLKKEIFSSLFSKNAIYNIEYESLQDLKYGIINLSNLLKKGAFVIRIFSNDPLNEYFKGKDKNMINFPDFNIYLVDEIEIIEQIDFSTLRFIEIYTIENHFVNCEFDEMLKHYSFNLGLDNYLEYTKVIIDLSKYDDDIISKLKRNNN